MNYEEVTYRQKYTSKNPEAVSGRKESFIVYYGFFEFLNILMAQLKKLIGILTLVHLQILLADKVSNNL